MDFPNSPGPSFTDFTRTQAHDTDTDYPHMPPPNYTQALNTGPNLLGFPYGHDFHPHNPAFRPDPSSLHTSAADPSHASGTDRSASARNHLMDTQRHDTVLNQSDSCVVSAKSTAGTDIQISMPTMVSWVALWLRPAEQHHTSDNHDAGRRLQILSEFHFSFKDLIHYAACSDQARASLEPAELHDLHMFDSESIPFSSGSPVLQ